MLALLGQVLDLISSDNLNVPSEEEVYRAVLSWVKHDIDGRRQHVPRVGTRGHRPPPQCSVYVFMPPNRSSLGETDYSPNSLYVAIKLH